MFELGGNIENSTQVVAALLFNFFDRRIPRVRRRSRGKVRQLICRLKKTTAPFRSETNDPPRRYTRYDQDENKQYPSAH